MSVFHDQAEFLKAADGYNQDFSSEVLASNLIVEECKELQQEGHYHLDPDMGANAIKEALDLMYVTAQYLNVTIGADKAKKCWDALHANNMSKCIDGKLVKREDGKVLKPEGYKPMNIEEYL
jgi:predicted HAD superfamily Cof-like phosphohydrolase